MRIRKIATLAVAIAMPLSAIGAIAAAEVASAGAVPDTGSITCSGSTTATLSVPFTPTGTLSKKSQTTLPGASIGSCSGTYAPGTIASASYSTAKIKTAYPKPGQVINNCSTFTSSPPTIGGFVLKVKWSDKTKSVITMTGGTSITSPPGFAVTGSVTSGSFAGKPVVITAALDSATLTALVGCIGGAPTPISSLGLNTTVAIG